jgi:hypothetical protein
MGWADFAIDKLSKGYSAEITPHGNSMKGRVNNGDVVKLERCLPESLEIGDIVLVRVKGRVYLHLIKAIKGHGAKRKFQIGNNLGGINGWVGPNTIYGIATEIRGKR